MEFMSNLDDFDTQITPEELIPEWFDFSDFQNFLIDLSH